MSPSSFSSSSSYYYFPSTVTYFLILVSLAIPSIHPLSLNKVNKVIIRNAQVQEWVAGTIASPVMCWGYSK